MKLSTLIELLQDAADECGDYDPEVRLAHQPQWPFEYGIGEVVLDDPGWDQDRDEDDEDCEEHDHDTNEKPIVYIGESSQLGYLPGAVSRQLGWR